MSLQAGVAKVPALPRVPMNDTTLYSNTARTNRYRQQAEANRIPNPSTQKPGQQSTYRPRFAWQQASPPQNKDKERAWSTGNSTLPVFSNPRNDASLMITETLQRRALKQLEEKEAKKSVKAPGKPDKDNKTKTKKPSAPPSKSAQMLSKLPFCICKAVPVVVERSPRSGRTSPDGGKSQSASQSPKRHRDTILVTGAFTFIEQQQSSEPTQEEEKQQTEPTDQEPAQEDSTSNKQDEEEDGANADQVQEEKKEDPPTESKEGNKEEQEGDHASLPITCGAPLNFALQPQDDPEEAHRAKLQERALASGYLVDPENPSLPPRRLTRRQRKRLEEERDNRRKAEAEKLEAWDSATSFVFKAVGNKGYFMIQTAQEFPLDTAKSSSTESDAKKKEEKEEEDVKSAQEHEDSQEQEEEEKEVKKKEVLPIDQHHDIKLTILAGSELLDVDLFGGKSDPYVIVRCEGEEKLRTREKDGTLEPKWVQQNEVEFPSFSKHSNSFTCEVWNGNIMEDDFMGQLLLTPSRIIEELGNGDHTVQLCARPDEQVEVIRDNEGKLGNLTIRVDGVKPSYFVEEEPEPKQDEQNEDQTADETTPTKQTETKSEEEKKPDEEEEEKEEEVKETTTAWCWMAIPLNDDGSPIRKNDDKESETHPPQDGEQEEGTESAAAADPDIETKPEQEKSHILTDDELKQYRPINSEMKDRLRKITIDANVLIREGSMCGMIVDVPEGTLLATELSSNALKHYRFSVSHAEKMESLKPDTIMLQRVECAPFEGNDEANHNLYHCRDSDAIFLSLAGTLRHIDNPATFDKLFDDSLVTDRMQTFETESDLPLPVGDKIESTAFLATINSEGEEKTFLVESVPEGKKQFLEFSAAYQSALAVDAERLVKIDGPEFKQLLVGPTVNESGFADASIFYDESNEESLYLAAEGNIYSIESLDFLRSIRSTEPEGERIQQEKRKKKVKSRRTVKQCGIIAVAVSDIEDPAKNPDLLWTITPQTPTSPPKAQGGHRTPAPPTTQEYIIANKGYPHLALSISADNVAMLLPQDSAETFALRRPKSSVAPPRPQPGPGKKPEENESVAQDRDADEEEEEEKHDATESQGQPDDDKQHDSDDHDKEAHDSEGPHDDEEHPQEEEERQADQADGVEHETKENETEETKQEDNHSTATTKEDDAHGDPEETQTDPNDEALAPSKTEVVSPETDFPSTFRLQSAIGKKFVSVSERQPAAASAVALTDITVRQISFKGDFDPWDTCKISAVAGSDTIFTSEQSKSLKESDSAWLVEWDAPCQVKHRMKEGDMILFSVALESDPQTAVARATLTWNLEEGIHAIKVLDAKDEAVGDIELELIVEKATANPSTDDDENDFFVVLKLDGEGAESTWKLNRETEGDHRGSGFLETMAKIANEAASEDDAPTHFCLTPAASVLSGSEAWDLVILPVTQDPDSAALQKLQINVIKNSDQANSETVHITTSVKAEDGERSLALAITGDRLVLREMNVDNEDQWFTISAA